jgi:type VI secretion system protein ImpA
MSLNDELLNPIPGANSAGTNLRYAPVYEKIKEARRQEDDAAQGEWRHERKLADWPLTIKLIQETLAKQSKDLQLAAWLTEALLRRDGVAGLRQGLDLLRGLIENFWDTLYPELEDGDAELRAAPLQWIGDKLDLALKSAPLARKGPGFLKYKESRAVGYEADAADNEAKTAARAEAIAEGKLTAEEFDAAFDATPKQFYVDLLGDCDGVLESMAALSESGDSRFGDVAPSFSRLRASTEEVRQTVSILFQKKREKEPDAVPDEAAVEEEAPADSTGGQATGAAPGRQLSAEPASRGDALERVLAVARYLRREEAYSPAPYLMLRGLRWGELLAGSSPIDATLLAAPAGETRQNLKRLLLEANWTELLEAAETAMGLPCGRGWLDLQRYVCRACHELGSWYDPIGHAVKSSVRALLADLPDLPQMTMMDDTATANAETQAWLKEVAAPAAPAAETPGSSMMEDSAEAAGTETQPSAYNLAMQAAASGRPLEGVELLSREIVREHTGRGRFHRKVQLAQLFLAIGREQMAYPILHELATEIEERRLEEWEASDAIAHPLTLLFRCLGKLDGNSEEKQRLYSRICRLDPVQAMSCSI